MYTRSNIHNVTIWPTLHILDFKPNNPEQPAWTTIRTVMWQNFILVTCNLLEKYFVWFRDMVHTAHLNIVPHSPEHPDVPRP